MNLVEEKCREIFQVINVIDDFLAKCPKAQATKIKLKKKEKIALNSKASAQ